MKQVVDATGNKLVGIFKKSDGSIVVINPKEFKQQTLEKTRIDEIADLKRRLVVLEEIIQKLIPIK